MNFMKSKLLIFFLFFALLANAQTNVSGAYFSNTNWSKAGSPYNVTGDVQVPAGVTLSIEPGVQINFNGDYQILVKGYLMANGSKSLPITLSSGSSTGKAMILFRSTNLSISQLSNLKFTGPKYALQLEDESEFSQSPIKLSGVLTVKNINLTNTAVQTKGYGTTASLVLDSATISSTLIKGVYPRSESITLKNSIISNSTINSDSYNNGINVTNSQIDKCGFLIGCCGGNININSSTLTSSTFSEGGGSPVNGPLKIYNSTLNNCSVNLPSALIDIYNCPITYNSGIGICFGNGKISNSKISGSGTAVKATGYSGYNIAGNILLKKCDITQNTIGVSLTGAYTCTIDSCNFENNTSYHVQNLSASKITAKNNWWGTTDASVIASKIYDYYDNINYGIVDYSASLASNSCIITLQVGLNGALKENNVSLGNGSTVIVTKGSTKTFTIIPNTGYEVATLSYNGTDVKSQIINNQYTTPTINANISLNVTFKKTIYKISVQTGGSGAMNLNYYYGDTPSFDFTPSLGYKIQTVIYNGNDVTNNLNDNVYTLPAITSNGTLLVNFVSISTDINSPDRKAIKVYTAGSKIIIQGTSESETVKLYDLNGQLLQAAKSQGNVVIFGVQRGAVYLVKTNTKTFKVVL